MRWLFQPLLILMAGSTESELVRQIEFLKAENQMLRKRLPKIIRLTTEEKSLIVKLGLAVGKKITALLTVATYQTYRRWVNQIAPPATPPPPSTRKPGRPRTSDELRELVLKIAGENDDWGYTRILGELKKLGITTSRSNVINILKSVRIDPKLVPSKGTWGEFLKAHAQTLWQCDFFSRNIITAEGIRQCFVLAFIQVESRRVFLSPATFKPNGQWMTAQAQAFLKHVESNGLAAHIITHDRDSTFTKAFTDPLEASGMTLVELPIRAPNTNAYIERFVQSIQQECLDRFIVFGLEHMDHLNREYLAYYHTERPHQAKGNAPLMAPEAVPDGEVVCSERLGGMLKHYWRTAA